MTNERRPAIIVIDRTRHDWRLMYPADKNGVADLRCGDCGAPSVVTATEGPCPGAPRPGERDGC